MHAADRRCQNFKVDTKAKVFRRFYWEKLLESPHILRMLGNPSVHMLKAGVMFWGCSSLEFSPRVLKPSWIIVKYEYEVR
jgi:hypothetical protein